MIDATFGELEAVLASELEELRRLVPMLEDEERALRGADVPAVLTFTEKKAGFARRIGGLENRRRALATVLGARLDISPESLTLSRLGTLVPPSQSRIAPLRGEFREVLDRLLALNSRNAFLMEQSLGSLQRLLADLIAGLSPGNTYASDGRAGHLTSALQLLDRRA